LAEHEPSHPAVTIRTPSGPRVELSLAEYRMALLWLVDFAGQWEPLETATSLVVDSATKAVLIRDHLRPAAQHLPTLASRGVDALEMLAARYWFRQEEVK
jgi:hypothetical protein